MQINRPWIVVPNARIAVEHIAAFVADEAVTAGHSTRVYLTGGNIIHVPLSVTEFQQRIEGTNR